MGKFANPKRALGTCDRCGLTYRLVELKVQMVKRRPTNLLVCRYCLDEDHPQLMQGTVPIDDPQALFNPRPDTGGAESRRIAGGWNPIGGGNSLSGTPNPLESQSSLGTVTVTTS